MSEKTLTAQQRAQLFAMATRQNRQMLANQTITSTPNTIQFQLPKARLLAGLMLSIKTVWGSGSSVSFENADMNKFIRRISLDLNNGFAPFVVSGEELSLYNIVDLNAENICKEWAGRGNVAQKEFILNYYLPCTTNPRDPIGLILLQNDQTNVTLNIDVGLITESGIDVEPSRVEVKVMAETFSIPANANAYPDLSVLKLVNGRKDSLPTSGQQIIKLSTGTIYRKLILKLVDENGVEMTPDDITSNIELVFNQADINYSIDPEMLQFLNAKELGLSDFVGGGVYIFDFSNSGGLPNLGGTRDFIDSANLTEFWIRFNTSKIGKCIIVSECLARLS